MSPNAKKRITNLVLLALGACFVLGGIIFLWLTTIKLPDFQSFEERRIESSTKIYDRTGEIVLFDLNENIRRTPISSEDMGDNIKNATVAIEDAEFYQHGGIRIRSIIRAVLANLRSGEFSQGGSTITQQIVKNTLLSQEKTVTRKIKEWILALKVERIMDKDKILEIYINDAAYGGNMYGIYQASKTYFGKEPIDLTLAEAAYLAAIPNAPSLYSPYGKNRDQLDARQQLVLSQMTENGLITQTEYSEALHEEVAFLPQQPYTIKAPHFVFYIKDILASKYGTEAAESGGLRVITTLDYELQQKAEEVVKKTALENEKNLNAENSALVVLDPKTGDILTMVGSRDYFDKDIDGNFNTATAPRQPGSSFKPFVYSTAFAKGYSDKTVIFDLPTEFSSACTAYGAPLPGRRSDECYNPSNFDNDFRGPMTLRNALAQSVNVPAVKMLYMVGLDDVLSNVRKMGIKTLNDRDRYGLSLVLGGGEVTLLDMATAYGTFANAGTAVETRGIIRIEDGQGKVLEETTPVFRENVLPKNAALMLSDILSDNVARTPTFGANSTLRFPDGTVAAKTGTTNSNRDAWVMGYTPSVVVGVWSGNNDNTPMKKGSTAVSGPAWNAIIKEAIARYPSQPFEKPVEDPELVNAPAILRGLWQGGESFTIDTISGKLATQYTPQETQRERVVSNVHTILHWVDRQNPRGPSPTNPEQDSQYNRWETAVRNWWGQRSGNYSSSVKPTEYDDVHLPQYQPTIMIITPHTGQTVDGNSVITILTSTNSHYPIQSTDILINDYYVGTVQGGSPTYSFVPSTIPSIRAENEIKLITKDSVYNKGEARTTFIVTN